MGKLSKSIALMLAVGLAASLALMFVLGQSAPERQGLSLSSFPSASAEQGRYLARAGNCSACHTASPEQPYAGGVAFYSDFGLLYSTNITPHNDQGIGAWSFADFYRAMKHGEGPEGRHYYPAFPYVDYAQIADSDLASIFLYLQTLEPKDIRPPDNALGFPFNIRSLLRFWKLLFHDASEFEPNSSKSAQWNRGAYLTEALGHCGACHSPRNLLGAEIERYALSGGTHMSQVKLGGYRLWSAPNITGHATGLSSWTEEDLVQYLQTGKSHKAIVHGPMVDVVMQSTRYLSQEDLAAMAHYIKTLSPISQNETDNNPNIAELIEGEVIYTVHCGSCHLSSGEGADGLGVSLVKNPIVQAHDPASLLNVILYGPDLPQRPFSVDRSNMKAFGKRLSDHDIAVLTSYLRQAFGNRAGRVTEAQVAAQR